MSSAAAGLSLAIVHQSEQKKKRFNTSNSWNITLDDFNIFIRTIQQVWCGVYCVLQYNGGLLWTFLAFCFKWKLNDGKFGACLHQGVKHPPTSLESSTPLRILIHFLTPILCFCLLCRELVHGRGLWWRPACTREGLWSRKEGKLDMKPPQMKIWWRSFKTLTQKSNVLDV